MPQALNTSTTCGEVALYCWGIARKRAGPAKGVREALRLLRQSASAIVGKWSEVTSGLASAAGRSRWRGPAGARIAVTACTPVEIEEVVAAITAEKGRAVALAADLTDRTVLARLVRDADLAHQQRVSIICTPSCWLGLSLCALPVSWRV